MDGNGSVLRKTSWYIQVISARNHDIENPVSDIHENPWFPLVPNFFNVARLTATSPIDIGT